MCVLYSLMVDLPICIGSEAWWCECGVRRTMVLCDDCDAAKRIADNVLTCDVFVMKT